MSGVCINWSANWFVECFPGCVIRRLSACTRMLHIKGNSMGWPLLHLYLMLQFATNEGVANKVLKSFVQTSARLSTLHWDMLHARMYPDDTVSLGHLHFVRNLELTVFVSAYTMLSRGVNWLLYIKYFTLYMLTRAHQFRFYQRELLMGIDKRVWICWNYTQLGLTPKWEWSAV